MSWNTLRVGLSDYVHDVRLFDGYGNGWKLLIIPLKLTGVIYYHRPLLGFRQINVWQSGNVYHMRNRYKFRLRS